MTDYTDNLAIFADFQKQAFEPVRKFSDVAAGAFEDLVRHNYAVLGDLVDYSVRQTQLVGELNKGEDFVSAQLAAARDLGERLTARGAEFNDIARNIAASGEELGKAVVSAVEESAAKAGSKAA